MTGIILEIVFIALFAVLNAFCDMLMQMFNISIFPARYDPATNRFPWHFAKWLMLGARSASILVAYLYRWLYGYWWLAAFACTWGAVHWVFFELTKYMLTKDKANHYRLF